MRIDFGAYYEATVVAGTDGTLSAVITPPLFDVAGSYEAAAVGPGSNGKLLALRGSVRYGLRSGDGGGDSNGGSGGGG